MIDENKLTLELKAIKDDIELLKERRIHQSSIPPQTIKTRHLEESIRLTTPSIDDLSAYANNAAALAAGLEVGDLYRISDTVGVVH